MRSTRHEVDVPYPQASPAKTSTSTAVLVPLRFRRLTCVTSGWRRAAPGWPRPGHDRAQHDGAAPTTVPAPTTAVHAAALGLSGPALTPGAPATTLLVPTTTPAQPTTTMDSPRAWWQLRCGGGPGDVQLRPPFDGHGRSWRHWGGTGASTATAGPVGTAAALAVGTAAALAVGTTLPSPGRRGGGDRARRALDRARRRAHHLLR